VDLCERGTPRTIGGGDAALICRDRLLEYREQEAPLGRRKSAGKEVIGKDELRLELHATDIGPRPNQVSSSTA
jgi:hypothetical protein